MDIPFDNRDVNNELSRRRLYDFTVNTFEGEFKHNWHLEYIAKKVQECIEKDNGRLILSIPFRHGKSSIASRALPAFALGVNPDLNIIAASHSSTLAKRMSRDVKRIMRSARYNEIFPDTKLASKASEQASGASEWEVEGRRGGYLGLGAGQAIQGRSGDVIVCDDLYGSREDAYSETVRAKIENWFDQDLTSRLSKNGSIIMIQTRQHHDDIIAYLTNRSKKHSNTHQWDVINFEAIREDMSNPDDPRERGEALWPWRKSAQELEALKESRPDIYFGPYQGKPSPPGGTLFKEEGLRYYNSYKDIKLDEATFVQSYDLRNDGKGKKSSYAVAQLWARVGPDMYLLDQRRGRWAPDETLDIMLVLQEDPLWAKAAAKYVENKADARVILPMLKKKVSGLIPVEPKGSKLARARAVQPYWTAGNIYLPRDEHWVPEFVQEILQFPASTLDDQVDAMTQVLNHELNSETKSGGIVVF